MKSIVISYMEIHCIWSLGRQQKSLLIRILLVFEDVSCYMFIKYQDGGTMYMYWNAALISTLKYPCGLKNEI